MFKKMAIAGLILTGLLLPQMAFAQQNTLLPEIDTEYTTEECSDLLKTGNYSSDWQSENQAMREIVLYCAVKTGEIHLWMVPYFITYFINFFIGLAGLVSVLFVLLGGFWYMTGGLTDDKEKGKKTITYALLGLVLTLLAWLIVNIIQIQVTT